MEMAGQIHGGVLGARSLLGACTSVPLGGWCITAHAPLRGYVAVTVPSKIKNCKEAFFLVGSSILDILSSISTRAVLAPEGFGDFQTGASF